MKGEGKKLPPPSLRDTPSKGGQKQKTITMSLAVIAMSEARKQSRVCKIP